MPSKYGDLSKKGDDLFNKGFEHQHYKAEFASKGDGFELTTKGALKDGAISSSHEIKMACPCVPGLTIKKTFTPGKDSVACEAEYKKDAAKVTACFSTPMNGMPVPNVSAIKLNWSNAQAHLNVNSNCANKLDVDAVVDAKHLNIGAKLGLDVSKMNLTSQQFAFNWAKGSMNCTLKTSCNNDFNAVCHNQVNDKFAVATSCTYGSAGTTLAIAGQSKGCCGTTNSFKLANNGRFAVSHATPFMASAKLTMSGEFDATNLAGGSHKLGAGLKFDF